VLALETHIAPHVLEDTDPRYLATMFAVLSERAKAANR
jgi:hypothetical protein